MTTDDARKFVNDLTDDAYELFMGFVEEHPQVTIFFSNSL